MGSRHSSGSEAEDMHGMKMRYRPILLLTMALLSGCDAAPEPDSAPRSTGPVERVPGSPSPIDDGSIGGVNAAEPRAEPVISEPFRGRWAMTPADCRAGSAEESRLGRIIVGASEIQFVHAQWRTAVGHAARRRGDRGAPAGHPQRVERGANRPADDRSRRHHAALSARRRGFDLSSLPDLGPDPSRGDEGPYRPTRRSAPLHASDPPVPGLPVMFPFEQKSDSVLCSPFHFFVTPAKAGVSGGIAIRPEMQLSLA